MTSLDLSGYANYWIFCYFRMFSVDFSIESEIDIVLLEKPKSYLAVPYATIEKN